MEMKMSLEKILKSLDTRQERVIDLQRGLTAIPALSPVSGGDGEMEKALWFKEKIKEYGLTNIQDYDAPDDRVSAKKRPNFTVLVEGKSKRTVWILAHIDIVPAGAMSFWNSDPFELKVDGDTIYGRGVEDNQQGIVSATLLAAELIEHNITPELSYGILLISDEEVGNTYGIEYVLNNYPDLIKKDDIVIVPDFAVPDGNLIEVGEKGVLWLKVSVTGLQCHASVPMLGKNSLLIAAEMILETQKLQEHFGKIDPIFIPDCTTITPTRIMENVQNTNTMSGLDVFYIDCRILPYYSIDEVREEITARLEAIAKKHNASVEIEVQNIEPLVAPTPVDSEVVIRLQKAIKDIYDIDAHPGGIGASTVANHFRLSGIPAAAWARLHPTAHMPNEHGQISYNINDAKVFAHVLFNGK